MDYNIHDDLAQLRREMQPIGLERVEKEHRARIRDAAWSRSYTLPAPAQGHTYIDNPKLSDYPRSYDVGTEPGRVVPGVNADTCPQVTVSRYVVQLAILGSTPPELQRQQLEELANELAQDMLRSVLEGYDVLGQAEER